MSPSEAQALADRLERCHTGPVYDVLRALGRPRQVLPSSIRPLDPERRLAGPAFTVSGRADAGAFDAHRTLLEWTGLLSRAPSGAVVVCQPNDHTMAHMGELSSETLHLRGVRGWIVDGGCRDTEFILRLGFRVFCAYRTPVDVVGSWIPDAFDEPIVIGGVTIEAGDFVLGDRDGVIVVPRALAPEVIARAEEVMRTESLVRRAIREGEDPQAAYLKHGKF